MRDIEKYQEEYIKKDFEEYQVKYRRKKVLEVLDKFKITSFLEIGCGMEPLFSFLNLDDFEEITVIEPGKLFFENALELSVGHSNVHCIQGYFGSTHIEEKKYGMVICSGLLNELENSQEILREIKDICNKSTIVHINVPNAMSLHRLIAKEMGLISDLREKSENQIRFQQHTTYNMELLKKEVESNGFEIIESGSYFVKPFSHKQMTSCMMEGIISEKVLDGLYNMVKYMPEYGSEIYVNLRLRKG